MDQGHGWGRFGEKRAQATILAGRTLKEEFTPGGPMQHLLLKYTQALTVLDRAGLEARTCECYAVVKKETDRLLPAGAWLRAN